MENDSWYCVELTRDDAGSRQQAALQLKFQRLFSSVLAPDEVAMYGTGSLPESDVFRLYFSPGCAQYCPEFLKEVGAQPCAKPADARAFLVGDRDKMRAMIE